MVFMKPSSYIVKFVMLRIRGSRDKAGQIWPHTSSENVLNKYRSSLLSQSWKINLLHCCYFVCNVLFLNGAEVKSSYFGRGHDNYGDKVST